MIEAWFSENHDLRTYFSKTLFISTKFTKNKCKFGNEI